MRDFSARASTSFAEGASHLFIVKTRRNKEKEKGRTHWNFSLFFSLGPTSHTGGFFFIVLKGGKPLPAASSSFESSRDAQTAMKTTTTTR